MTTTQQTVYLITEAQREALLSYLQNRPYKEVAAGIQFLMNAPTAVLNVKPQEGSSSEKNSSTTVIPPSLGEPVPPPNPTKAKEKQAASPTSSTGQPLSSAVAVSK